MRSVPFQTIMVAIDSAEVSHVAFEKAVAMAEALGARLLVVHVLSFRDPDSPQPIYGYSTPESIAIDEVLQQKYQQEWNSYVEHYEALLKQKLEIAELRGVDAEAMQPHGSPGRVLCEVARAHEVELLIVGSHQRRGISELMMGSTSNYIMHHAPCSVLVVHPHGVHPHTDTQSAEGTGMPAK